MAEGFLDRLGGAVRSAFSPDNPYMAAGSALGSAAQDAILHPPLPDEEAGRGIQQARQGDYYGALGSFLLAGAQNAAPQLTPEDQDIMTQEWPQSATQDQYRRNAAGAPRS